MKVDWAEWALIVGSSILIGLLIPECIWLYGVYTLARMVR